MSSSNCCFLTRIQVSQEAGQVVWYSHLFQNFPQLIVIHTVKGFGIVNKAEINAFLELSCFFDDPADVGNLISGSSAFSKTPAWTSGNSRFMYCWRVAWRILSISLLACEMSAIVVLKFYEKYTKKHTQAHSYNHIKYIIEYWYLWSGTITRLTFSQVSYICKINFIIHWSLLCKAQSNSTKLIFVSMKRKVLEWKWLSNSIWLWSLPLQKNKCSSFGVINCKLWMLKP